MSIRKQHKFLRKDRTCQTSSELSTTTLDTVLAFLRAYSTLTLAAKRQSHYSNTDTPPHHYPHIHPPPTQTHTHNTRTHTLCTKARNTGADCLLRSQDRTKPPALNSPQLTKAHYSGDWRSHFRVIISQG